MVVLGFDEPEWVQILRHSGPEIAVAIMRDLPDVRELTITPDAEHHRVVAAGTTRHHDHYTAAYEITEHLASLWDGFADQQIGLRIQVDALQVDVPGRFFADPGDGARRRRWATLSSSQLAHR